MKKYTLLIMFTSSFLILNFSAEAPQAETAMPTTDQPVATRPYEADAVKAISEIKAQLKHQKEREAGLKERYTAGRGNIFGFESLYRYGAVVMDMSFDTGGTTRTISLKVLTRKEHGILKNSIQIADITRPEEILLQMYSADWRGSETFFLDERSSPHKEQMHLTMTHTGEADTAISLRPAGNASAGIRTTLSTLLRERAYQAVYAGDRQTVGTREFCVLGQSGAKGSLLYFSAEVKGLVENGSIHDLMPTFVAVVTYRDSDGSNRSYANTDLGEVDGIRYHLEHTSGSFEVKPGRGEEH